MRKKRSDMRYRLRAAERLDVWQDAATPQVYRFHEVAAKSAMQMMAVVVRSSASGFIVAN